MSTKVFQPMRRDLEELEVMDAVRDLLEGRNLSPANVDPKFVVHTEELDDNTFRVELDDGTGFNVRIIKA
jgi:hypothetical protein